MKRFREPRQVGDKLIYFAQYDLAHQLAPRLCKPCGADECDGCYGMVVVGHLENQIGEQGIAFMKQLAENWRRSYG